MAMRMLSRTVFRISLGLRDGQTAKRILPSQARKFLPGYLNFRSYSDVASDSTIRAGEKEKFSATSDYWWDPNGPHRLLHSMNELRIPFIKDGLGNSGTVEDLDTPEPLRGLKILDIGCGGGVLSEPLARLGASVTGIDINEDGLAVGRARKGDLDISYVCTTIEDFAKDLSFASAFDAVIASEVIEHVSNTDLFIKQAVNVLKPSGSIFFTTINRTPASKFAAIFAAEYLLCLVPKGTHSWEHFVTPEELQRQLSACNVETRRLNGTFYNPVTDKWQWTNSIDILYCLHGVKAPN